MRRCSFVVSLLLPLLALPSCLRDFDQFDASGNGDGDSDLGGRPDSGGMSGNGGTALGGASGGAPNLSCGTGQKLCVNECVSNNLPQTGCNESSCEPCPSVAHREATCNAGACSVGQCEVGFFDCDGSVDSGCEHSQSTYSELACGGCDADCTTLGLTNCQNVCGCAQDAECGDTRRNVVCTERLCVCDDVSCKPGETCERSGNTTFCQCGGGTACNEGWVCCPSAAGATCKQLDANDVSNCGACGVRCADGQLCVEGACE